MYLLPRSDTNLARYRTSRRGRTDPRSGLGAPAYLVLPDRSIRVGIVNISLSGALLHCPEDIYSRFDGRLIADYIDRHVYSAWHGYQRLGIRFLDRLSPAELRDIFRQAGKTQRPSFGKRPS